MKLLLDTHILLWVSQDHPKLSRKAKELIINGNNDIYYSSASIWELMIKKHNNKINLNMKEFINDLYNMNIYELSVEVEHVLKLDELANHHEDPFDRILVAQALAEPIKLVTHDRILQQYSPDLILFV